MTDTNAEVSSLRAEVNRLTTELDHARLESRGRSAVGSSPNRAGRWRTPLVVLLLVLVFVISPLAVVATWTHDEISDTDRYVATISPLASDPALQNAIADKVTDAVFERLDVKAVTDQTIAALAARGLPPRITASLAALSTPMVSGIHGYLRGQVLALVRSDRFQTAWIEANRLSHSEMMAVLTGGSGQLVSSTKGDVRINLASIIELAKSKLQSRGFSLVSKLPTIRTELTIFESADLAKARTGFRLLSAVARALPFLVLLLLGLAVWVARERRRTLVAGALVVGGSMIVLGIAVNVFRGVYLNAIPASQLPSNAAGAVYDALAHFIRLDLRAVLLLFLIVAAVAWVGGADPAPTAARRLTSRSFDALRHGSERVGLRTGSLGTVVWTYRTPMRVGLLGVALVVYVMAAHPSPGFVLGLLACVLAGLLALELVARGPSVLD